jgi:putative flavoprotein involved in K+ transport
LPGFPIPRAEGAWVTGPGFAHYLTRYATQHRLDVRTGTAVTGIERVDAGWLVHTGHDTTQTDVLVIATGHADQPWWPRWPDRDRFGGTVLHSADYRRPEPFVGSRVLIVGSGNSATEIATELVGHAAAVWLSVRTSPLLVPTRQFGLATHRVSVLGRWLPDAVWDVASRAAHWSRYRDLARYGLSVPPVGSHTTFRRRWTAPVAERGFAAAVRSGGITVVPATVDVGADGARLANGDRLDPDVVIAATGYRPNFTALVGHLSVLDDVGRPLSWGTALPGSPGLFLVGAPSLQGDLREHGREARRVAAAAQALTATKDPGGAMARTATERTELP